MNAQLLFMAITVIVVVMHARTGSMLVGLLLSVPFVLGQTVLGFIGVLAELNGSTEAHIGQRAQWVLVAVWVVWLALRRWMASNRA